MLKSNNLCTKKSVVATIFLRSRFFLKSGFLKLRAYCIRFFLMKFLMDFLTNFLTVLTNCLTNLTSNFLTIFDEFFWWIFWRIFWWIFWQNFYLLTIASFRIRVPLILFLSKLAKIWFKYIKSLLKILGFFDHFQPITKWLLLAYWIIVLLIRISKTEKSLSPIGSTINDHGLWDLYGLFCSKSKARQQDYNSCRNTWGYEAAQLTRSLKKVLIVCGHNFGIPAIVFCYSVYIHSLVVSGLVESHIYRQDRWSLHGTFTE